jgi:hypothetical protein
MGKQIWWGEAPESRQSSNEDFDLAKPSVSCANWRAEPCPSACYPLIGSALADLIELLNIPAIRDHGSPWERLGTSVGEVHSRFRQTCLSVWTFEVIREPRATKFVRPHADSTVGIVRFFYALIRL